MDIRDLNPTYGEYLEKYKGIDTNSLFNAFIMPYNMEQNYFELTSVVGNIGEAVGDWRHNKKFYERIQGIVMDTRYLMYHYTGNPMKEKVALADCIEAVLGKGEVPPVGGAPKHTPVSYMDMSPKTRWSYANVWDPKSINGGTPKYSVSLIIPKSDVATVKKIEAAIQAAYEEGESKLKGSSKSVPSLKVLKTPLRDGDLERPDDAAYADSYFINANSASAPGIVDADRQPILERSEVYSGVYGRASINFYAFNSNGNKGIACGLNNLQKIADGEPLGGKSRAEDDFETDDNDDFLS